MSAREDLPALEAKLRELAIAHPKEAMFSIMEALITVACGDNPALIDFKRKWIYVGILQNLAAKGIS